MEKKLRDSVIDIVRDIPWGTHFCQFYQEEDLKAGLENNKFCMRITSQPLNVEEAKNFIFSVSPLHNSKGKLTGDVHVARNIAERKQEEYKICRYNSILEGVNRIFGSVVRAETEEELGNACLSVALEITGSQFGFINEMGADGLLHDVAKSELGWEQCFMHDKTGHHRPPSVFALHGLYGSVIVNEKGFFTNDPPSHPDSIGIPEGHPPITSFLGVPLVQDGKAIGLIAVANREGGYSFEQQEDLEAIAPAVMQTLQRRKAEEALRLSNLYNRSLIEASLDPLVTIGHDGKIKDVNVATEQVTGYFRRELIGTDFSDYFTEPEKARAGYQQVFTDGKVWDYPLEIQHRDGQITPVLYNASVYRNENGEVIGVFAAARDITERQKAEEKIQRLANAVESSDDAFITKSLDGIITSWNKGAKKVYGYLAGEVLGKNISILEPDSIKGETKYLIEKIKKGEKIKHYETLRLKKDGSIINASVTLSPVFDVSKKLVAISCITRDITESKKAEEALRLSNIYNRSLIEASLDPLVTIGSDGKITDVNEATETVTGYSRDRLIGTDFSDYFTEPERAKEGYKQVFREGLVRDYALEIQHRNGHITPVLYNARIYRDEYDNVTGIFAAARDITELKMAEEALEKIDKTRMKEIHHRIKNNLQVISSLLSLEAERFSDTIMIEAFKESQNRVASIALIHEELYKGDELDTLDFAAYLRKLAADIFRSYNLRNGDINLKLDLKQVYFGMDTAIPLGIVINELVSNALKHAFPAGKRGEININLCKTETFAAGYDVSNLNPHCTEKNNYHYTLAVADNGLGIPEEIDFRETNSLGLQLVNILVEQINGCIELKRDEGTKFTIWFSNTE